jgi:hypothetical protein
VASRFTKLRLNSAALAQQDPMIDGALAAAIDHDGKVPEGKFQHTLRGLTAKVQWLARSI